MCFINQLYLDLDFLFSSQCLLPVFGIHAKFATFKLITSADCIVIGGLNIVSVKQPMPM